MTLHELEPPPHFSADTVGQLWRVLYQERARQAEEWARQHNICPAMEDHYKIGLLLIDVQNTFCLPDYELFVGGRSGTGAVDDNRRLCEFMYRNMASISQIIATLDTHQAMQIFHAIALIDEHGQHPEPYTLVSVQDIEQGKWQFNRLMAQNLNIEPAAAEQHLMHYVRALQKGGKYELTIWPYHAMQGGIGHALVPAVEEAVFFHTIARCSRADIRRKGGNPLTEHYSALGAEVTRGPDGQAIAKRDQQLVDKLLQFDALIVAGQAQSHCVAWTIDDLLHVILERDAGLAGRVYLLEDCTSPVVVPGAIDYTETANAAFERFAAAGMHIVNSCEPVNSWPGIKE